MSLPFATPALRRLPALMSAFAVLICAATGVEAKDPNADTSNPAYAQTPVSVAANTTGKPAPPAGVVHPGILVNRMRVGEIRRRVAAGVEPQKSAFEALKASPVAALDYAPTPWATVECGSYSNPNFGCKDEERDAQAAYAQALLWTIT